MSALAGGALAQSFPERPITLINPYAAGGPADLLARTVAEGMSETLGRRSSSRTARARAPRSVRARSRRPSPTATRCFIGGSPSHVITPALMKDADYDGIKSFTPIATVANVPNVLVVPPSRPYKSVKELVAAARRRRRQDDICFDRRRQHSAVSRRPVPASRRREARRRALQGRRAGGGRSPRRPDRHGVSQRARRCCRRCRAASCARSPSPTRRAPRRCPIRRPWPRPAIRDRDEHLVRNFGAGQNAARDRRQAPCRHRPDAEHAKSARTKSKPRAPRSFSKNPEEYAAYLQADAKLMLELIKARQHDGELMVA